MGEGTDGRGVGSGMAAPGRAGDGGGDFLVSAPGRSPVLDAAELEVLRSYGTERDVAAGEVLFADGDETYDLIVMLACGTSPVAVVGGGNSAGQAALFLSRSRAEVRMLIRGDSLEASMSRYLIDRIVQNPRIIVSPRTRVTALAGAGQLEGVRIRRGGRPAESDLAIGGLFVFIGAEPRTGWLAGQLAEDSHGFLLTGTGIRVARLDSDNMNPLFLETSRPGIFAVGDVRSGSVKRAAAAIGGGSMAVRLVFDRLQHAGIADAIELGTGSPRA